MALLVALGVVVIGAIRMRVLHRRLRRLQEQAITDPLTGAFNRRHMEICLAAALERRRRSGERASLLLFDVDRFKTINDTLGHAAGDQVLKAIVGLAVGRARKLDVLFRIGGEEFALLLAGAGLANALLVAEEIRVLVANARFVEGRRVSISVGVSELLDGQPVDGWFANADRALYRAKRGGRNRVAGRELVISKEERDARTAADVRALQQGATAGLDRRTHLHI
jgi:diguanylate cyclase (GGDEF)-like protein